MGGRAVWNKLDKPWQEAFKLAWEAYKRGTIPIGCVITSKDGNIVSRGRNQIFDETSDNSIAGTNMAHAEINAMLGLRENNHPDIRSYILYTTTEPCPMCFGTMVMMNIRNIQYGAQDRFAGAISLNDKLDYIKNKNIVVKKGEDEIEVFQLILQAAYEYECKHPRMEDILNTWRETNNLAIDFGKELNRIGYFLQAAKDNKDIEEVYNDVIEKYLEQVTCPICGKNNNCRHSKECWCHNVIIPKGILDIIPEDKKGKACICKSCIDKYRS
nr:cysteine-rich CWC family protein [Tissierella carlieri]